ncbi:PEP-CTERM sorting domain-containing protein [Chamaesiphon sp. OTE_8_metabat_110]|uniref:PEP-CTERM sorting domain-containing protein n=1 Tax=Chamaesiphon sp. OTE_8_metabat_110 TaxID=2964696 RepID=UPI00286D643D|nr:PEP-CTERM sorting domain-containing protein [Chamaesiphon sp. OTE_8_metabat_110]
MKTERLTNLPSFKAFSKINSITKAIAISGLAMGVATMNAAPAQAVVFTTGQASILGRTGDFFQNVIPGSNFDVNFNASASADTLGAPMGSSLSPFFNGNLGVTPSTGSFQYVSGSGGNLQYRLSNDLVFAFANNINYTVPLGSTFQSVFSDNGNTQGVQFGITNGTGFFTDRTNGDRTLALTDTFTFSDISVVAGVQGGNYTILASPVSSTAVPEPFTVIGTLVGGAAALRMKKKLANATKN